MRWNRSRAGELCPSCSGTGTSYESGDTHRSPGVVPCPRRLFQGHGYPTCIGGVLTFSQYDLDHWEALRRVLPEKAGSPRALSFWGV